MSRLAMFLTLLGAAVIVLVVNKRRRGRAEDAEREKLRIQNEVEELMMAIVKEFPEMDDASVADMTREKLVYPDARRWATVELATKARRRALRDSIAPDVSPISQKIGEGIDRGADS